LTINVLVAVHCLTVAALGLSISVHLGRLRAVVWFLAIATRSALRLIIVILATRSAIATLRLPIALRLIGVVLAILILRLLGVVLAAVAALRLILLAILILRLILLIHGLAIASLSAIASL